MKEVALISNLPHWQLQETRLLWDQNVNPQPVPLVDRVCAMLLDSLLLPPQLRRRQRDLIPAAFIPIDLKSCNSSLLAMPLPMGVCVELPEVLFPLRDLVVQGLVRLQSGGPPRARDLGMIEVGAAINGLPGSTVCFNNQVGL